MTGRGETRDIDDVFDADWHAMQGSAQAARDDLGFRSPCLLHRRLGVQADEDIQFRIKPADPLQQRRHQLDR